MVLLIANVVLVVGALVGMYCISQFNKLGFVIFLGVEVSMTYIGYATHNYGLCVAAGLYLVMNVFSYIQWSKKDVPNI